MHASSSTTRTASTARPPSPAMACDMPSEPRGATLLPRKVSEYGVLEWDREQQTFVKPERRTQADVDGNRPIHYAEFQVGEVFRINPRMAHGAERVHGKAIYEALVEHSDIGALNKWNQTPLHLHVMQCTGESALTLLEVIDELRPDALDDALRVRDAYGNTVLHLASTVGPCDLALLDFLLTRFAALVDIADVADHYGGTAYSLFLETLMERNDLLDTHVAHGMPTVKRYIEWLARANVDLRGVSRSGDTLIHACAARCTSSHDPRELATVAIDAHVDVLATNDAGETALHVAAANESCSCTFIDWLLSQPQGLTLLGMRDGAGRTPRETALHVAAEEPMYAADLEQIATWLADVEAMTPTHAAQ